MIKHRDMMKVINSGEPFSCVYAKRTGELTTFQNIARPPKEGQEQPSATPSDKRRRRTATGYESLVPFQMPDGSMRELYTRLITQFNGEDVIL